MKSFDEILDITTRQTLDQDRAVRSIISQIVPEDALEHLRLCRIDGAVLHLTFDSALWTTRLRFQKWSLVKILREGGVAVVDLRWHVIPAGDQPVVPAADADRAATRPDNADSVARRLRKSAQACGGELGQQLERLAAVLENSR